MGTTRPTDRGTRLQDLLGVELPVVQAPMAGASTPAMVIAVANAGGLGSLPGALSTPSQLGAALEEVRAGTSRPFAVNFFCHTPPARDLARDAAWRDALARYCAEAGLDPAGPPPVGGPSAFDDADCDVVESHRPAVVSFHFGLPPPPLLDRVRASGATVLSSATTVAEARWLQERGVDAVIAVGGEAGGHRATFLSRDHDTPMGTLALVPQVVDAVGVPVIAAGGIVDPRGTAAALALGAAGVQAGTAYLLTPEAAVSPVHRLALGSPERATAVTNVLTGRSARAIVNRVITELGPISALAPAFPAAASALAPLRAVAEARGSDDFSPLWAGQAFPLARAMSAAALTEHLAP